MSNVFNQDSEIALLSILINHPQKFFDLRNIGTYMFSSTPNQLLYESIIELNNRNNVADLNLLQEYLSSTGKLAKAGGVEYLNYLKAQEYDPANLREFEQYISDAYKSRTLLEVATNLSGAVHSGEKVENIISSTRNILDKLTSVSSASDTVLIKDMLEDSYNSITERIKLGGKIPGITSGLNNINMITGGYGVGDVWIIAGRPGQGKSAVMCNSALSVAKSGIPAVIFSLEMRRELIVERLLAIQTGIPITNIHLGLLDDKNLKAIRGALDSFENLPLYIDSNYFCDLDYVIGTTKRLKRTHDIRVGFLDYIQLMAERSTEAVHELGKISRGLKLLSNDLGLTFIILSQLNRGVELKDDKRPMLSDLRQSGNLEEDADIVGMLYRDEYYNRDNPKTKGLMEFIFRKHRNGPTGTIMLNFEEDTNLITDK